MSRTSLIFERGEPDPSVRVVKDLRATLSEGGTGVVAFLPNPRMRRFFTERGEALLRLHCKAGSQIVDMTEEGLRLDLVRYMRQTFAARARDLPDYSAPRVTTRNYHRFGATITTFVRQRFGECDGYIIDHGGSALPEGKQVILNPRAIERLEILKPSVLNYLGPKPAKTAPVQGLRLA